MISTSEQIITILKQEIPLINFNNIPEGFNETIDKLYKNNDLVFDRERFNILISFWQLPPVNEEFFNHYALNKNMSLNDIKTCLDKFIVDALWHFGDIKRGYLELSTHQNIEQFFNEHKFQVKDFTNRLPWKLIEKIPPQDRGFLGYVSGQNSKTKKNLLSFAEQVIHELEINADAYKGLSHNDKQKRIFDKITNQNQEINIITNELQNFLADQELDLFTASNNNLFSDAITEYEKNIAEAKFKLDLLNKEVDETILKIENLKKIGRQNQEHYLRNIENIDIYIATSMRNDEEYKDMYDFVTNIFHNPQIVDLNLRYFDPTLCYCDSRIDKGIIECLLVRSSKVTIYCAQDGDTFGKDSELAATMAQGKPVIVYVPTPSLNDPDIQLEPDPQKKAEILELKQERQNKRAAIFKDFHPLALQVGLYDGVARGVIVVRSPEECAKVLYKILTNQIEVTIHYEQFGLVLREKDTHSVLRVMTGWNVLAQCFWNQFSKTQNPKSGLPK
ncbi:MAG: hypothetical protein QM539_01240 [Alphaproteobacteria bacterium]|nr:hypothetical protein [Alphaproteobacteria bacterium]